MINLKDLIKASVHFGHQKSRWCPKMAPYVWGIKNSIYLIDISKTASQLEKASKFLSEIAISGKPILWIGTKKAAQDAISEAGKRLENPYVNHRWIGGTLTNFSQVKKSITKLLHYEDIIQKAKKYPYYTKKELSTFQKMVDRLQKNIGGIRNLSWPIGAIVIVDVKKEKSALKEAAFAGIPVVALVDTNSDPELVDYVIPANDDAPRSIKILIDYLVTTIEKAKKSASKKEDVVEQKTTEPEEKKEPEKAEAKKSISSEKAKKRTKATKEKCEDKK